MLTKMPFGVLWLLSALIGALVALAPETAAAQTSDPDHLALSEKAFAAGDWTYIAQGTGPTAAIDARRLEVTLPATSSQSSNPGAFSAGAVSRCLVRGDFDMEVGFRLDQWPARNGVQVLLGDGNLGDVVAR